MTNLVMTYQHGLQKKSKEIKFPLEVRAIRSMFEKLQLKRVFSSPPSFVTSPSITLDDDDDDTEGLLLLLMMLEVVIGSVDDDFVVCDVASGVPDMISPSVPDPTISISSLVVLLLPLVLYVVVSSPFDRIDDFDSSEQATSSSGCRNEYANDNACSFAADGHRRR